VQVTSSEGMVARLEQGAPSFSRQSTVATRLQDSITSSIGNEDGTSVGSEDTLVLGPREGRSDGVSVDSSKDVGVSVCVGVSEGDTELDCNSDGPRVGKCVGVDNGFKLGVSVLACSDAVTGGVVGDSSSKGCNVGALVSSGVCWELGSEGAAFVVDDAPALGEGPSN
jgi:hypothetical protein